MGWSTETETKFVPHPDGRYKSGATPGHRVETKRLVWSDDQPVGAGASGPALPNGSVEIGPAGKKFVGFGLILFGLWMLPPAGAADSAWLAPIIGLALGFVGLTKGIAESWGAGWRPFEGTRGTKGRALRFVWAFRPRIWMILWGAIVLGFVGIGSPHLRIQYGPQGCDYLGLNGWESYGVGGSCPLVKAFPLRSG